MPEAWILPIGILSAFAVFLLVPLLDLVGTSSRSIIFWCPFVKRKVTVSFAEKGAMGISTRMEVRSCSALKEPHLVTCGKRCLGLPESALEEVGATS